MSELRTATRLVVLCLVLAGLFGIRSLQAEPSESASKEVVVCEGVNAISAKMLRVTTEGQERVVTLLGIDIPAEKRSQAVARVNDLVSGSEVKVLVKFTSPSGRLYGDIELPEGVRLTEKLVAEGLAVRSADSSTDAAPTDFKVLAAMKKHQLAQKSKDTSPEVEKTQGDSFLLDPSALTIGAKYQISRRIPVMPAPSLSLRRDATEKEAMSELSSKLSQMTYLESPGQFEVRSKKQEHGTLWYQIRTSAGTMGWVSSVALMGQDLKRVVAPQVNLSKPETGRSLGVSRQTIQKYFGPDEFTYEEGPPVDGEPQMMARCAKTGAFLHMVGPPSDLKAVAVTVGMAPGNQESIQQGCAHLRALIDICAPWSLDWVMDNIAHAILGVERETTEKDLHIVLNGIPASDGVLIVLQFEAANTPSD